MMQTWYNAAEKESRRKEWEAGYSQSFINSRQDICILSDDELVVLSDRPEDSGGVNEICQKAA